MFIPIAGKSKLNKLNDFFTGKSLRRTKWRELLEILRNIIDAEDELAYLGFTGIKQDPMEVPLLALK